MSYLSMIIKQKKERDKYEEEQVDFKGIIMDMELLYQEFDGDFLTELKEFINKWKEKE